MIPKERKAELVAMGLPSDQDTIRRARAFVLRAGLTLAELADMAALNQNSLRVYLSGSYCAHNGADSNTLSVRAALKQVMDRHEIAHTPPAAGAHHETREYSAIRRSMLECLSQGTACLVDGPPGTQKTYTFRRVAEEINRGHQGRAVYVYTDDRMSPQSFLIECCIQAGIPSRGHIQQLLRKLAFFLGAQRTLFVVDEVQHLDVHGMEILRHLLDTPPYFGVALGGSHEVSLRLKDWRMEQWRSRLRRAHQLSGLSGAEARKILAAELGELDAEDAAAAIADATVKAVRERKEFSYISARNLFFAIEGAKSAIDRSRKEAIA